LFRSQAAIRPQILEPMPAMERSRSLEIGGPQIPASSSSTALLENGVSETPVVQESSSTLIDLLGLGDPGETVAEPVVQSSGNMGDILGLGVAPAPTGNLLDGLGGLDLGGPVPSALPATNGGLDNLLNGVDTAAFVTPKETPSLVAYEKHGLRVVFTFPTATATAITLLAHNLTGSSIQEFVFQAAVPKSMSLQLFPPSSPTIPPGGSVTQQLEVNNPSNAALKMRLKISFIAEGIPIADQVDQLSNFPVMAS